MQKGRVAPNRSGGHKPWWEVSIATTAQAESAVGNLLSELLAQPVSSFTDADSGRVVLSAYLPTKPNWPLIRAGLLSALELLAAAGVTASPWRIGLRRVAAEDWRESWKRHFKPLSFRGRLLVKPSWSRRQPRAGQKVVVLDPGLSFGTGQHPTTAFCLDQLVRWRRPGQPQGCLDVGTGSGILAIAAARLGYRPVLALDLDPEALRVAKANAQRNHIAGRISFRQLDVKRLSGKPARKYDLVCANLVADLLLEQRDRLMAQVAPGGLLVLAGILRREFEAVRRAYAAAGCKLAASQSRGEWRSASFLLK